MFSLIITIISIALVAALAVATIYYGGSAFTQGSAQANASTLINAGQQVSGAATIFKNNRSESPADIATLATGEFLQGKPVAPKAWSPFEIGKVDGVLAVYSYFTGTPDSEICKKIQFQAVANEASVDKTIVAGQPYGCFKAVAGDVKDNTATPANVAASEGKDVFFFKL